MANFNAAKTQASDNPLIHQGFMLGKTRPGAGNENGATRNLRATPSPAGPPGHGGPGLSGTQAVAVAPMLAMALL